MYKTVDIEMLINTMLLKRAMKYTKRKKFDMCNDLLRLIICWFLKKFLNFPHNIFSLPIAADARSQSDQALKHFKSLLNL